jgi:hypothetical protein
MAHVNDTKLVMLYIEVPAFLVTLEFHFNMHTVFG